MTNRVVPLFADSTAAAPAQSLKIMTVNVHKGFGIFNRRFMLPELRDAVNSLSADLVFLQEVVGANELHAKRHRNWPTVPHYEYLADTLWQQFAYGRNAVYPEGEHGNALLSKFPIVRYDNRDISIHGTEARGLLHCELAVPGASEVHAICVHLGLKESHRQRQLALLCELVESLPENAPIIVAGDFNDWRHRAQAPLAQCGLQEVFVQHHGAPARSFPARWPWLRLDRIYLRHARGSAPQVVSRKPWPHLSDHLPLSVEVKL